MLELFIQIVSTTRLFFLCYFCCQYSLQSWMSDLHIKVNKGLNALLICRLETSANAASHNGRPGAWVVGSAVSGCCIDHRKLMKKHNTAAGKFCSGCILSVFLQNDHFLYPLICLLCACPFLLCCQALYHIQTESPSPSSSRFPPSPFFSHPFNFCKGCPPEFFGPQSAPEQSPGWLCAIFQPLCALCSCGPHCEDSD